MDVENINELRLLVLSAPIGICVLDAQTLVAEIVNDSFIRVAGKRYEEIIGKYYWDTFSEVREYYETALDTVIRKGESYYADEVEMELIRHGNKETLYVTFVYVPLKSNGEVKKVAVWVLENTLQVTQRQKTEESEKFSRTVFYNSPVAKLVYTGDNMLLREANEKMLDILGKGNSIIGMPIMEAVPELRQTDQLEYYQQVLRTGEQYSATAQRIEFIKSGTSYVGYYDYSFKPLYDGTGKVYGVIGTAIEVTDQVMARHKLEEAESSMRGAVELAQLGTWSIDVATNGLTYSDRLIEWFGYDPAARDFNQVIPILSEEDRERVASAVAWALNPESGGIYDEVYTVIHPETRKKRILHAQGKTVFDPDGKPVRMNGTAQDVTMQVEVQTELENQVQQRTEQIAAVVEELQATNEELEDANIKLLHSNEELEQFAYIASHDLQEPLRKISTFAEILESHIENGNDKTKLYLDKIVAASTRMSKLIKGILGYSSLSKEDAVFVDFDLNQAVQNAVEDFDLIIARTGATVTWNELPVIKAVPLQMSQLFANMIGNALKFIRTDVKPIVEITCTTADAEEIKSAKLDERLPYYKIRFSDNGIGISPEYTHKIFSIFQRLHQKSVFEGTGIGLAMCKKIALNHKGEINAEGSSNDGAVFNLYLPANS